MTRLLTAIGVLGLAHCAASVKVREAVINPDAVAAMQCIAVLPFENHSDSERAGELVAQEVASNLLTSERFNVIAPGEAAHIIKQLGAPLAPTSAPGLAQRYAKLLGVRGVVVGSVLEFGREDLTTRTGNKEPVVGFVARLIDVTSGDVVWSSTGSNYDYQVLFALPQPPQKIVHDAVVQSVEGLIKQREATPVERGLCATSYALLKEGGKPDGALVEEISDLLNKAPPSTTAMATLGRTSEAAGEDVPSTQAPEALPPLPGVDDALPALPQDEGTQQPGLSEAPGAGEALPALPDADALPALPDADALPALPEGEQAEALPALPGVDELPALPDAGQDGEALPALPGVDGGELPPLPEPKTEDPAQAEPAAPKGKLPRKLKKKFKKKPRRLATQMYRKNTVSLKASFPKRFVRKNKLHPKTQRSLNALGVILKELPKMRVRLDVRARVPKRGTHAAHQAAATKYGELMTDYLVKRFGLAPKQVSFKAYGKPATQKLNKDRVDIVVLAYP